MVLLSVEVRFASETSVKPKNSTLTHCVAVVLSLSGLLLPFVTLLLQELLLQSHGVRLRGGDALIHFFGTAVIGLIGLILFCAALYDALKNGIKLPFLKVGAMAVVLTIGITAIALASHGADRFCSETQGECGRWI